MGSPPLLALAGSVLLRRASEAGIDVHGEGFADRAYAPDGTLMPRSHPGAVIEAGDAVVQQALGLARDGRVDTAGGTPVRVEASSICIHGDTPGAAGRARSVRRALQGAGIEIRPFA